MAPRRFGRRFYDHYTLEKDGPHSLKNVVQERALKAIAVPAGSNITMAELFDGVKYRAGKSVLASVGERIVTDLDAADDDVQYRKAEADPSKEAFLGAFRRVVMEHVGRERKAPGKAEEAPSKEAFLNAYRKVVADQVGGRVEKAAAAPRQPSPAAGEGTRAEPADREAEAAARAMATQVFAELQADWKAHVAAAQRQLGGHPFYHGPWSGRYSPNGQGASG